jgi:hypothetical protein
MNKKVSYFYIYNPEQSDFFVKNGAVVLEVGKGNKGDVYVKFPRTDKEEEIFSRWVELCNKVKGK